MTENKKRELLQQYIKGNISPKNRHALERVALDDIFLFEALEGYSKHMTSPDLPFYKSKPTTVLPIRTFMTMAASFIVLATVAFLIKQNINPSVNEKAISHMEEESIVSEDQIVHFNQLVDLDNSGNDPLEKKKQKESSPAINNDIKIEKNRIQSKSNHVENLGGQQNTRTTNASNDVTKETVLEQEGDIVFLDDTSDPSPSVESILVRNENIEIAQTTQDVHQSQSAIYSTTEDVLSQKSSDSSEVMEVESTKQTAKAKRSIQLAEARGEEQFTKKSESKSESKKDETFQEIKITDSIVSSKDTVQYETKRSSFPQGGWSSFNSNFDNIKEQVDCSDLSFTFKFQIQENGDIENLELTKVASVDQTGSSTVLECLNTAKEFIQSNDKWETNPPNRKVKRTVTLKY